MGKMLSPSNYQQRELFVVKRNILCLVEDYEIVLTESRGRWDTMDYSSGVGLNGSFEMILEFSKTFFCMMKGLKDTRRGKEEFI